MQKVKIQIIEGCIDLWFNLSKKRFEMFKKLFYSNTCLIKNSQDRAPSCAIAESDKLLLSFGAF